MSDRPERVVVVGASAAGLTVAETLRREGFYGRLTLVGDEAVLPYDRPPLSKQVLCGTWLPSQSQLRAYSHYADLEIELRLGVRATALDVVAHRLHLSEGEFLDYDTVVISTGLRARPFRTAGDLDGVHVLRTLDHAIALRNDLDGASSAVVLGAGVLGCEIAASVRGRGLDVTVVDPVDRPMSSMLDARLAPVIVGLHRDHGTRLLLGIGVTEVRGGSRVEAVVLEDGSVLPCDVLLVAIGSVPATDWLASSGLDLSNGVVCDSTCAAAPDVYAAGDVARWFDRGLGHHTRVEHRMNATEQGIAVGRNVLGAGLVYAPLPYFWSDQHELKLQSYGRISTGAEMTIIEGDLASRRFVALFSVSGRVTGVIGASMPGPFRRARNHVSNGEIAA